MSRFGSLAGGSMPISSNQVGKSSSRGKSKLASMDKDNELCLMVGRRETFTGPKNTFSGQGVVRPNLIAGRDDYGR